MATQPYVKPLPTVTAETKSYWDGCKAHELRIPKCQQCGALFFPPQGFCPHCLSDKIGYQKASGKGQVYSMSIVHQNRMPGFKDEVPYIIAYITLDEGVQMFSNVIGTKDPYQVKVGMAVEVLFDDVTPEITLPKFRPRP
jgi:uncharacterized OB-fold protein